VRVLLVDDDDTILEVYGSLLTELEFEVDTVSRASTALERMAAQRYDVVLSDIQMPEMGGIEFLRAVRQIDLDVPVVLMTGDPTVASAIAAVEYGAFRYLQKPVPETILEDTVRRAARHHALVRLQRDALALIGGAANGPSDRAALEARFEQALARIWMALQPIVAYPERRVHAYETLLRSDEPALPRPAELIEGAERLGRLRDLGRAIRQRVGASVAALPDDVLVFVNLHPADLNDPQLFSEENPLRPFSRRVVFEVTERASLHSVVSLSTKLQTLRGAGFELAIDDLGAGYAGLTSMAQLEPEYVKLDMSLIRGIDVHPTKQKLVRSMATLCRDLGKRVIAEGVETPSERDVLMDIGCDLLQGFLFGKPSRESAVHWG
jgi:EAL domain-containing protein (putative c-di-GMP-specific phosphodiesterase class I)